MGVVLKKYVYREATDTRINSQEVIFMGKYYYQKEVRETRFFSIRDLARDLHVPMKRQKEEEVLEELVSVRELWVECIFPTLKQESIGVWLKLALVCKQWLEMSCSAPKSLRLGSLNLLKKGQEKVAFLSIRYGPSVIEMETNGLVLPVVTKHTFPSLKKLSLISEGGFKGGGGVFSVSHLKQLTHFTLSYNGNVANIGSLKNLTHLSLMFIDTQNTKYLYGLESLKKIEHLCLGKISDGHGTPQLYKCVPDIPPLYLESNDEDLFMDIGYSGRGRVLYSESSYEGEWLGGVRHGQGTLYYKNIYCKATWSNDKVTEGIIDCGIYSYKGDLLEEIDLRNRHKILVHGLGVEINTLYNSRYEGEFIRGFWHGRGKYYRDDVIEYDGWWEYGKKIM
jgi:hypothetical protein